MEKEIGDKNKKETYYKFTHCTCKKIWVDGCEDYVRIGGNEGDYKVIRK